MSDGVTSIIPDTLVSPGVRDTRQRALAQVFGEALAGIDLGNLTMADPMTVDARLLPFLVREFAAQDFIDPDLPEAAQRRILANIWELKSQIGYDAGVRFGLSLLGMTAIIEHWHQQQPMGAPNTHRLTVMIDEVLDVDGDGYFSPGQTRATLKMIDATKRQSQDTELRVGVPARPVAYAGAFALTHVVAIAKTDIDPPPTQSVVQRVAIAAITQITSIETTT